MKGCTYTTLSTVQVLQHFSTHRYRVLDKAIIQYRITFFWSLFHSEHVLIEQHSTGMLVNMGLLTQVSLQHKYKFNKTVMIIHIQLVLVWWYQHIFYEY